MKILYIDVLEKIKLDKLEIVYLNSNKIIKYVDINEAVNFIVYV